jgi:hypothetical protein
MVRAGAAEAWARSRNEDEPRLVRFDDVSAAGKAATLVAPRELATALELSSSRPPDRGAASVARLAAARLGDGATDDLAALEPIYLRPPRGLADTEAAPVTWL